jgi:hypothetical protein
MKCQPTSLRYDLSTRDLFQFAAFPSIVTDKNNETFVVQSYHSPEQPSKKLFHSPSVSIRQTKIPAIPSHNRKYGYGETNDGVVFPFQCPVKVYSGNKEDSVTSHN